MDLGSVDVGGGDEQREMRRGTEEASMDDVSQARDGRAERGVYGCDCVDFGGWSEEGDCSELP